MERATFFYRSQQKWDISKNMERGYFGSWSKASDDGTEPQNHKMERGYFFNTKWNGATFFIEVSRSGIWLQAGSNKNGTGLLWELERDYFSIHIAGPHRIEKGYGGSFFKAFQNKLASTPNRTGSIPLPETKGEEPYVCWVAKYAKRINPWVSLHRLTL